MPKTSLIASLLCAVVFTGVIPFKEVGISHLLNPEWPSHARLHEAWQILTNAGLSIFAMIIVWNRRAPRIGIGIALIICLSFLTAWLSGPVYGGSMLHSDGTQTAIAGINLAVIIVTILTALLALGYRDLSKKSGEVK